jgi:hypothetical protein
VLVHVWGDRVKGPRRSDEVERRDGRLSEVGARAFEEGVDMGCGEGDMTLLAVLLHLLRSLTELLFGALGVGFGCGCGSGCVFWLKGDDIDRWELLVPVSRCLFYQYMQKSLGGLFFCCLRGRDLACDDDYPWKRALRQR